ncbi:unnamed protein product [Camellia sinensis]
MGKVQDGRCNLPVFILRHLNEASRVRAFISASVTPTLKQQQEEEEKKMIEVVLNDRLGKKVRVKCNEDDTIGDLKKLVAAQTGTRADKIRIQKWYNVYKDHITLKDYEIHEAWASNSTTTRSGKCMVSSHMTGLRFCSMKMSAMISILFYVVDVMASTDKYCHLLCG